MKGKALRRAMKTKDAIRIGGDVPLISDTTELITTASARTMLDRNSRNRPVNWRQVEEYAEIMKAGGWKLHAQGLILDGEGNILTGQQRLWAVIFSGVSVHMRVSRGSPAATASVLDRGRPQSARDLASRVTEKRHTPIEASLARAIYYLDHTGRPSKDVLAAVIVSHAARVGAALRTAAGTKRTRAFLMILAAICHGAKDEGEAGRLAEGAELMAGRLEQQLAPQTAQECWGRGLAFRMALQRAAAIVQSGTS